jgi:hypothetical protein
MVMASRLLRTPLSALAPLARRLGFGRLSGRGVFARGSQRLLAACELPHARDLAGLSFPDECRQVR